MELGIGLILKRGGNGKMELGLRLRLKGRKGDKYEPAYVVGEGASGR